jgi:hypothetical protein
MLSAEQLQGGVPLTSAHAGVVDPTRYLHSEDVSRLGTVTVAGTVSAPLLAWKGCTTNTDDDDGTNGINGTNVDLEAVAAALTGFVGVLFADVSQGSVNMCTSMAFVHAYTLRSLMQGASSDAPQLSAVYAYYYQRIQECQAFDICRCVTCPGCPGTCDPPCMDCGSYLSSAATVFSAGVCPSALWPYTTNINTPPDEAASAAAGLYRITSMACIQTGRGFLARLRAALMARCPVVVFLSLTPSQVTWMQARQDAFNTTLDGVLRTVLPDFVDQEDPTAYVGHAVLAVGLHDDSILLRNNFGNAWGARGRFCIATKYASTEQFHTAVAVLAVTG